MNLKRTKHSLWTRPENEQGRSWDSWVSFSSWKNAERIYSFQLHGKLPCPQLPLSLTYSTNADPRMNGSTQSLPTSDHRPALSPAPAKEGWDRHADTNGPRGQDHHQCMLGVEADVAKGLTDDNVALESQESQ